MTRSAFITEIEYLKEVSGIPGTSFEYLGKSMYDKILNILRDKKNIVTHFHIPRGNPENVEKLKTQHLEIFNSLINDEMASFYTCFNGFEFRYINIDKAWESFKEDDIFDWDDAGFNPDELIFEDLKNDTYEIVLDEFQSIFNVTHLFEENFDFERLSNPSKKGLLFYGNSVEYEDYGIKTFIPPANILLDDENKVTGNNTLYNLNFHHSFRQLAYGKTDAEISLFHVDDAGADVRSLREDFRIHFKKNLIRVD